MSMPTVKSSHTVCANGHAASAAPIATTAGLTYLKLLNWAFVFFSSTRLLMYLPTLWAIHSSGSSSQHSLLTWGAWVGSHLAMAAWLFENNGRRMNKAIAVLCGNSLMCVATCLIIVIYR